MDISLEDRRVHGEACADISEVLKVERLKSDASMRQNLSRAPMLRQPSVYLVTLTNSRKLKVTSVEERANKHFKRISEVIDGLEDEEFLPKIIKKTQNSIYCDYVEGEFPQLESREFVDLYARVCAKLHSFRPTFFSKYEQIKEIQAMLAILHSK